ncbi:hypothetical protein L195_g034662 [Trifolium pratense]|uniref:Uncharacterized protein n=1 Tax=Trifolium pratense TaxID=57577 RepID=A0A2K3LJG3_TRIPR|nr:hypothetical protein L195_g034662 [Trifolium pratense]
MDSSRVTENLDSLWFYTNILTSFTHEPAEVPSLTHPLISSSIQPKTELQKPNAPLFFLNQQCESAMSSSFERETEKKKKKRERRMRRKIKMVVASKFKQQQSELPPFDDDVAMKQHLKLWAYAVASHAISHF